METVILTYWPQLIAAGAALFWLARLESAVRSQGAVTNELRREQGEINRRAQDQAITLARIDESLSAIKLTLDRLVERMERERR